MILEFVEKITSYGIFVWASFSLVAVSCWMFYLKTKKSLKKYEKEYFEQLNKLSEKEREDILRNSKVAKKIFVNFLFCSV